MVFPQLYAHLVLRNVLQFEMHDSLLYYFTLYIAIHCNPANTGRIPTICKVYGQTSVLNMTYHNILQLIVGHVLDTTATEQGISNQLLMTWFHGSPWPIVVLFKSWPWTLRVYQQSLRFQMKGELGIGVELSLVKPALLLSVLCSRFLLKAFFYFLFFVDILYAVEKSSLFLDF